MAGMLLLDAWMPLQVFAAPLQVLALVPVIAVEAFILLRQLHLGAGRSLKISALANVLSTVAGVPFALAFAEIYPVGLHWGVLFGIGWKAPVWFLFVVIPLLMAPFFLLSWGIEYLVVRKLLKQERPAQQVRTAVREANLYSYSLLLIVACATFA